MRILFLLKRQLISGGYSAPGRSSGLFNSAQFVCDMLHDRLGHDCRLTVIQDNNEIDREVTRFRPDIVIIEALWVVPEKFAELHRLHPQVLWVVRNHSAIPFLAHEGNAMNWLLGYQAFKNVFVGCNDRRTQTSLELIGNGDEVLYLPNYYPPSFHIGHHQRSHTLNIGCFGAIRPLKNQLIQAVAAQEYSEITGKYINFHINSTRIEGDGNPILKNLRYLFRHSDHNLLVEHPWLERDAFLKLIRRMDVSMQVSYTETFNLVTADAVTNDVPIVVSPEISWVSPEFQANPNDSIDIVRKLTRALHSHGHDNLMRLRAAGERAIQNWAHALNELACR